MPPSQHWQPCQYQENAPFVTAYGRDVLAWLAPQAGERILDVGCGDGALTAQLAASGADVFGIDGSANMVVAAQAHGLQAACMDAQRLDFHAEFDAVFSNAALHWMPDAAAVLAGVYRALKPGGRFVAEMGGAGNVAAIHQALAEATAAHGFALRPVWYFPTPAEYSALLQQAGLVPQRMVLFARPTPLPTGITGWLATFAEPLLAEMPPAVRTAVLQQAAVQLQGQLPQENGCLLADYVRLRFEARKDGIAPP